MPEFRRKEIIDLAHKYEVLIVEDSPYREVRFEGQAPAMMHALGDIATKFKLTIGTFGHAGDGNLHPTILTDRRNTEEWHRVEAAIDEIFEVALSLGGTLSGEHGIGLAKSKYLEKETNRATVLFSRRLKKALDPKGILNPGKIIGE